MESKAYLFKNFIDLYLDSIDLILAADDFHAKNPRSPKFISMSRGSIILSLLSLECAANCCLSVLGLGPNVKNEVDKLDFITKFHYFTIEYPTKNRINYSKVEVGRILELKKLRNDYVHPKVLIGKYVKVSDNKAIAKLNKKDYPLSSIPSDPTLWEITEAVKVLKYITDFYNYFFIKVCEFSVTTTTAILAAEQEYERDNPSGVIFKAIKEFAQVNDKFKISAKFLGAI